MCSPLSSRYGFVSRQKISLCTGMVAIVSFLAFDFICLPFVLVTLFDIFFLYADLGNRLLPCVWFPHSSAFLFTFKGGCMQSNFTTWVGVTADWHKKKCLERRCNKDNDKPPSSQKASLLLLGQT